MASFLLETPDTLPDLHAGGMFPQQMLKDPDTGETNGGIARSFPDRPRRSPTQNRMCEIFRRIMLDWSNNCDADRREALDNYFTTIPTTGRPGFQYPLTFQAWLPGRYLSDQYIGGDNLPSNMILSYSPILPVANLAYTAGSHALQAEFIVPAEIWSAGDWGFALFQADPAKPTPDPEFHFQHRVGYDADWDVQIGLNYLTGTAHFIPASGDTVHVLAVYWKGIRINWMALSCTA